MRLSKSSNQTGSRLLLSSGYGISASAQSCCCNAANDNCCDAEVAGLRSGAVVAGLVARRRTAAGIAAGTGASAVSAAVTFAVCSGGSCAACCGCSGFTAIFVSRSGSGSRISVALSAVAACVQTAYSEGNFNGVAASQPSSLRSFEISETFGVVWAFRMFTRMEESLSP